MWANSPKFGRNFDTRCNITVYRIPDTVHSLVSNPQLSHYHHHCRHFIITASFFHGFFTYFHHICHRQSCKHHHQQSILSNLRLLSINTHCCLECETITFRASQFAGVFSPGPGDSTAICPESHQVTSNGYATELSYPRRHVNALMFH